MTVPGTVTAMSVVAFGAVMVAQERLAPIGSKMDPTLFAAAIVTVIAALGGVTVQIINSVSAARDRREAAAERKALLDRTNETAAKTDTIVLKADGLVTTTAEIRELTNSTNSNLQAALALMTEKYAGSQRALSQAQEAKLDTAAAQAIADIKHALASPPPGSPQMATHVLDSIEENTDATAKNTARTDAAVTELKKDA